MKRMSLEQAVDRFVRPGMHLNFASTPSRSNAAIRAVARRFRGTKPEFVLSTTGFHSTAHLLGMLRLGRRYVACFFGDNYPTPRPNALYQQLLDEGAELQHWSLWAYVSALRAAAFGEPFALTRPLSKTTWGEQLARDGMYSEVAAPHAGEPLGLLSPLVPDITFVHAPVGDEHGYAWFSPPHSEGFHGALAARSGVILTVDAFTDSARIERHPELVALPAHRVLAICEEPFGAHPQPVHFAPDQSEALSYDDDYAHYGLWREIATNPSLAEWFVGNVLEKDDLDAYRTFVGRGRLESLRRRSRKALSSSEPAPPLRVPSWGALESSERQVVLAARSIADGIHDRGHRSILAGIGLSFSAARLAKRLLASSGHPSTSEVELMVETGFCGFGENTPDATDSYLLSRANMVDSRRLTGIESVLGSIVRGSHNTCVGVIGCAEVDPSGDLNSTFVDGKHLVGSGGACDIAIGAKEVLVLARSNRLVPRVEYVTSPGPRVSTIVTEDAVLVRTSTRDWSLVRYVAPMDGSGAPSLPWSSIDRGHAEPEPPPTPLEWAFLLERRREADQQRESPRTEQAP